MRRTGVGRISPRRAGLAFTFIAPEGFGHPKTRTRVRLLGPCFKTGRMKPYDRQRPRPVGARTDDDSPAVQVHCTQSTMLAEPAPPAGPPRKARVATPLSGPTRSPEAITLSEVSYLPRGRFRRSEQSLTRAAEKCDAERGRRDGDSPSDLHPAPSPRPAPEFLRRVANSMRFPTNGFTYS